MKTRDFVNQAIVQHVEKVVGRLIESSTPITKPTTTDQLPEFTVENAEAAFKASLKENATGGATGASSVAVVSNTLGEKSDFTKKDVNKKLSGYGNMLTSPKLVKLPKTNK